MNITFYEAPYSSAAPVLAAMIELEVPHERIRFDLSEGKQKSPEFLKLNPNGCVPTIVVDGTPMFEALAILTWLGERFGVDKGLWPAESAPARLEAMSWATWAYVTYGSLLNLWNHAASAHYAAEFHNDAVAKMATERLERCLAIVEERLETRAHILGEDFSLADLVVASVIGYAEICGVRTDGHPRVHAWLRRCQERPSFVLAAS